ncbi:MAG: energy transducer TonB [Chloroflexota bacterium]|nr:energy transducer TonB [Acidobacteriota bacterium]MDQ3421684.1 energy transducer TonB [Acidobacteriota bacterium]MDQ3525519.1 energy transducer TonB [Chloroflexota bacterium]
MLGSLLLGVLLAHSTAVLPAEGQSVPKRATTVPAQDPVDKPWPPEGVLVLGQSLKAPQVVHEVKPRYTADAMRQRIQGLVEVEAVILADGTVGPVRVVKSLDEELGLDEQAVNAVKQWRFRPGTKDGEAVPVMVKIEMTFTLKDRR